MKRIAKGNTAEIFEYGENRICKLFYPEYPKEYIRHEFCNATMAWKLGIRTPFAHELIICNGREGIIYDRIIGEELCRKILTKQQNHKLIITSTERKVNNFFVGNNTFGE